MRDKNYDEFKNNRMLQDAVIREIEIIGEATKNLSMELEVRKGLRALLEIRYRELRADYYLIIIKKELSETDTFENFALITSKEVFIYSGNDEDVSRGDRNRESKT